MDKRNAETLKSAIESRRTESMELFERLAEQYVRLAEERMMTYLVRNPRKIFYVKYAVPILDVNLKEEKIIVGDVLCARVEEVEKHFINPERVAFCNIFYENTVICKTMLPLVQVLRARGFEPKLSEVMEPLEKLYPFF